MDVQYFDRPVRCPIEHPVWIPHERHDPYAGLIGHFLRALQLFGDASDDELETKVECFRDRRIVLADVIADIIEVAERFLGVDNLHGRQNLSNAALTCSSVAKRPLRASFRPRSIPASSSGVA